MTRKPILPSSRRHVHIYDEDWTFLLRNFGMGSQSGNSTARVIREIIHRHVQWVKARQQDAIDEKMKEIQQENSPQ